MDNAEPYALRRDPARLHGRFDVLVVGGGIYGAWIACDAARRGLSVALIEQGDWAGGASSASSKLIHGGLRYLEYGQVALVTRTLAERTRLLRLAPHRVRPLRFIAPVWPDSRTGAFALGVGLAAYDGLAALAGHGPGALPGHQRFSAAALREQFPYLAPNLRAGFAYGDASEDDARFCLEVVAAASAAGAVAINRCALTRLTHDGPRVTGGDLRDTITGATHAVPAAVTVLAIGAWSAGLLSALPPGHAPAPPLRRSRGVHLVMPPLPSAANGARHAFLLTTRAADRRKRRVFFLIPWLDCTLLGTTDDDFTGPPGTATVTRADADHLLAEATARCPGLGWRHGDIRAAFAGERTLRDATGAASSTLSREWELAEPAPGLLASLGGKYTSSRVEAALTVDRIERLLSRPVTACATAELPFPWRPPRDGAAWLAEQAATGAALGLDPATARAAALRLGTAVTALHHRLRAAPHLARRIVARAPACLGEAVHAVTAEMAHDLDDILRRRLALALTAPPNDEEVHALATAIAPDLGWSPARAAEEATSWSRSHRAAGTWRDPA
jgi:glycerol-3-phosphate dehydrogenase